MKRFVLLTLPGVFLLTACQLRNEPLTPVAPIDEPPPVLDTPLLLESEARQIAQSECVGEGESLSRGYYNEYSKTWWFDAKLKDAKEGCSPACVVFEDGNWEINWRCTGLIPEEAAL